MTLGLILGKRSKYTDAIQVLSDASARLKNTQGSEKNLERSAMLLGQRLLESGQVAEAEAYFRACLVPRGKERQILFDEDSMRVSMVLLAEALVRQGRKEEALAVVENMEGFSSYRGDWTEYCHSLQEEISKYSHGYTTGDPEYTPHLFSMLRDKTKPDKPLSIFRQPRRVRSVET